jgi:hypothetical protein
VTTDTVTHKFNVGGILSPEDPVLVFERTGDAQPPSLDKDASLASLKLDKDGNVAVKGEPGATLLLFQQTGEDEQGAPIGKQVSVTVPFEEAAEPITVGGDDPQDLIAHQQQAADAAHADSLDVIDSREQEALKQEGLAPDEPVDPEDPEDPEIDPTKPGHGHKPPEDDKK